MDALIEAPRSMVEAVASLRLPPKADQRLQTLMDLNNDGKLTAGEREELVSLVEMSETLSLLRTEALQLLRRAP